MDINNGYKKGFSAATAGLLTLLTCLSLPAQASDIEIYQQAKSGTVTLMLLLDISGSMADGGSYDLPAGSSCASTGTETSTNGSSVATYSRAYCDMNDTTNKFYFYKRTGSSGSRRFYECTNKPNDYNDCVASNTYTTTAPSDLPSSYDDAGNNVRYYYKYPTIRYYKRITRVQDGVFDLLYGNTTKNIIRLPDDKVIGLSAFSYGGNGKAGYVLVPARALNATVSGKTQRQILLEKVAGLQAGGNTPTANAYAEAASYLMGTTTFTNSASNVRDYYFVRASDGQYAYCNGWSGNTCSDWRFFYTGFSSDWVLAMAAVSGNFTSGFSTYAGTYYRMSTDDQYSGFPYSSSDSKASGKYIQPTSLSSQTTNQQCSGQGVYVLTDGQPNGSSNTIAANLMKSALSTSGSSFNCSNSLLPAVASNAAWECIGNFSAALINKQNPTNLAIKTAVVGFGSDFNGIPSFNKALSQAQNIANVNNSSAGADQKNAARWGIYGEGGWYSGSSSQDVVDSVNSFINSLSTVIPAVTTGTPTIPVDSLNTVALQPYAYYPQFQPTPDKTYQVWFGNVKKYKLLNGALADKDGNRVVENNGKIIPTTTDLWSVIANNTSTDEVKALSKLGGALSKLPLQDDGTSTLRKLLTNRVKGSTGNFVEAGSLSSVTKDYITDTATNTDPNRGYLMNLLGYKVDATQPANIDANALNNAPELRQLGGVMHSSPILLTQSGRIQVDASGNVGSADRDDYILYGSTQGLLHVVKAGDATNTDDAGKEVFSFVPNEMIENQKEAFLDKTTTGGGLANMFYGVDGPWVAYTEYVPSTKSGYLTVGVGKGKDDDGNVAKGKQWVYGGLRMGGNSYYSLDLSDMTTPALKFHIDPVNQRVVNSSGSTSVSTLQNMGESWSKPTLGWVNWQGTRKLVMFVGGGYDRGYESDSYDQTNKKGAGVYMFDADTGALLWSASNNPAASSNSGSSDHTLKVENMDYSVVSQIKAVDRNSDGLVDHLYFGDLGGQVWRVDVNSAMSKASGSAFAVRAVRLLNLHLSGGKSPRFYNPPSFTVFDEPNVGTFAVVNIGSGNRSKPLIDYSGTENTTSGPYYDGVYAIYDKDVASTRLYQVGYTLTTQELTRASLTKLNRAGSPVPYTSNGWYYPFVAGSKIQSEKVMGDLIAINKDLYVGVFDGSKDGMSGDCGAGVKGESFVHRFCLPYGVCQTGRDTTKDVLSLGAGIISPTTGVCANNDPTCRSIFPDPTKDPAANNTGSADNCTGAGCYIKNKTYGTQSRLIPQRWYEQYANPKKVVS